ncbi:hypothetical protein T11_10309 [Trichinella zimbabwensis]|uniref:Uncharacterized protein n=1 Tax=Trichinella zimbabwensis TaxID=268475 RepID=A0A0V1GUH1_9BILA|nr:hypothetical protein T11_10309 [Trichinella zimbabwensis]
MSLRLRPWKYRNMQLEQNPEMEKLQSCLCEKNLLPDSDVYLVSTSITNTGIDIYEKYSQYPVQNFSKEKISDS